MKELNKANVDMRDNILFGSDFDDSKYSGGIRRFRELTLPGLKDLIDLDFIDLKNAQNDAPTVEQIYRFLTERMPYLKLGGYAVSPNRDDYRVSIDEIYYDEDMTDFELSDFSEFCSSADEYSEDPIRAWWD